MWAAADTMNLGYQFENIGVVVPASGNFTPADVRIADIDGDGRADVCFIHDNGDIGCSRNGGQGRNYYWQGFSTDSGLRETVFTGKNKGDKTGVRLGMGPNSLSMTLLLSWIKH